MVNQGGAVLGLMNITDVVNDEAKHKGALVLLEGELGDDLVHVLGLGGGNLALEELGEVSEGADGVHIRLREGEVVKRGACLIQVRQVDVMPVGLESIALALDVVSEGSALSEGMACLLYQGRE